MGLNRTSEHFPASEIYERRENIESESSCSNRRSNFEGAKILVLLFCRRRRRRIPNKRKNLKLSTLMWLKKKLNSKTFGQRNYDVTLF